MAPADATANATASDEPSNPVAAPGSGFGLGSSADGPAGGGSSGDVGRSADRPATNRTSGGSTGATTTSTTTSTSSRAESDLPDPPAVAIEVPAIEDDTESIFGEVGDLDREASTSKFAEFRELCDRNTELLVRLARARKAMLDGGEREQRDYLAVDARYAELGERMGEYMAQSRWSDRDREVMGLMLSRSNDAALRRVRTGS